jgi:hypothetical protein
MARRTTIDIDAGPFVRSHMRAPSGYGSWAFSLDRDPRDVCRDVVFTPAMTYTAARVWIKAWVRQQQATGAFPADVAAVTLYAQP